MVWKEFDQAERGELLLTFSLWNFGEIFGIFDERRRRGWLTEKEFSEVLRMFSSEIAKLLRLKALEIVPVSASILTESWGIILNQHVYAADALQITACIYAKSDALLSADKELVTTSRKIGLTALNTISEEDKLARFLTTP